LEPCICISSFYKRSTIEISFAYQGSNCRWAALAGHHRANQNCNIYKKESNLYRVHISTKITTTYQHNDVIFQRLKPMMKQFGIWTVQEIHRHVCCSYLQHTQVPQQIHSTVQNNCHKNHLQKYHENMIVCTKWVKTWLKHVWFSSLNGMRHTAQLSDNARITASGVSKNSFGIFTFLTSQGQKSNMSDNRGPAVEHFALYLKQLAPFWVMDPQTEKHVWCAQNQYRPPVVTGDIKYSFTSHSTHYKSLQREAS